MILSKQMIIARRLTSSDAICSLPRCERIKGIPLTKSGNIPLSLRLQFIPPKAISVISERRK